MPSRVFLASILVLLAFNDRLAAQCPDGTPPPCAGRAAPRALDERSWIVLPFSNVARASDLDWLSDASVHLLYNDMSHWTDIHVVDDERVADLLRSVPEAERSRLGLDGGRALARRAGARNLVMGDLLREGPRTSIIAKVFDAATGARLRTVRVQTVGTDSISSSFSRLAQLVLAVPPPEGTTLSGVGTSSVQALQAYTAGMQAWSRYNYDSAVTFFRRAITLDSTFALAHLGLARALGLYLDPASAAERRRSYAAASRFSVGLPERERLLIAASQATTLAARCDLGGRLLRLDSSDTYGWVLTGVCQLANQRVIVEANGRARPVGSWNIALQAFEHQLSLHPDDVGPFGSITSVRGGVLQRFGCSSRSEGLCPADSVYVAANVLDADTLVSRFERWRDTRFNPLYRSPEAVAARHVLLERTRAFDASWVAANPRQWFGHQWYAQILLELGDPAGADRELAAVAEIVGQTRANFNRFIFHAYRLAMALQRERPGDAEPLLDSLLPTASAPFFPWYQGALGRFSRDYTAADSLPGMRTLRVSFLTAFAGVAPPDYDQTVRRYAEAFAATVPTVWTEMTRQQVLELGTVLGFHTLRSGPGLDTASAFPLLRFQAYFARGDTTRARRALADYDATVSADGLSRLQSMEARELFSAESHLELGDSAVAWDRMQSFARRWLESTPFFGQMWSVIMGVDDLALPVRVAGRAWLLYGDLAMAHGTPGEARRAYRMVVGMWEHGEPPVQPLVARARAALAQLGN